VSITDDAAAATQSTATRGKGKGTDAGGGARGPQATESEDTDGEVAHFHVRSFQSRHNHPCRPTLRLAQLARHALRLTRMSWSGPKGAVPSQAPQTNCTLTRVAHACFAANAVPALAPFRESARLTGWERHVRIQRRDRPSASILRPPLPCLLLETPPVSL